MGKSRKNINQSKKRRHSRALNKTQRNISNQQSNKKRKYVIGIIAVPLSPNKKYFKVCGDSYIASSHLEWLKTQGVETLIIPYDTKKFEHYFNQVHGLYLPSGGMFAGTQMTYYNCCKRLLQMAMKENDKGNYFPVWGCCMGFQQMLILADGNDDVDNFLQTFDSFHNYMTNIKITKEGKNSRIFKGLSKKIQDKIQKKNSTMNNHKMGITPHKFNNNPRVCSFYKNVGTSKDRKGREFVAIIEAHHYPFWGVQWHPERNDEMNDFVKFFCGELKRSKKPKTSTRRLTSKNKNMVSKRIDCMNYSGNLYKKCDFYWHKRTSAHNKKLCNVAQLSTIDNNDGTRGGM